MSVDPMRALQRSIDIARLDATTFERVEADESSTLEAGVVLVAAAIVGSLGSLFVDGGLTGFLAWIIATIGGWYVWAWASAEVAERLFQVQTTNTGEMLRVLGYASAPRAIGVIPLLGFVALVWTLVALVFGIRQAGEMTLGQAAVTGFIGFIPTFAAYIAISVLL